MDLLQTVILGTVQGLTEFIPVSSSGHLLVLSDLFNLTHAHLFVQALDFGTTLALIIFFRHRLVDLASQVFIQHNYRLLRNIIITCLPVGTVGLLMAHFIEGSNFFSSSLVVAIAMGTVGLLMIFLEKLPRLSPVKDGGHLSAGRALLIGLAQCLALIPGASRSGSTIVAARLTGLQPAAAAEYSFMVCIPVMLGLLVKLIVGDGSFLVANLTSVAIGNLCAFIASILAIRLLLNYLSHHPLAVFGYYRVGLSLIIIALVGMGIL